MHLRAIMVASMCGSLLACPAVPVVQVVGPIRDLGDGEPLAGVQVCLLEGDLCVETDGNGDYHFDGVEGQRDIRLTLDFPGYVRGLVPIKLLDSDHQVAPVSLGSDLLTELQAGLLGLPAEPETGQIVFSVSNGIPGDGLNHPDVRLGLMPAAGEGPFYTAVGGLPDREELATTDHGGGVLVNVAPGNYRLVHESLPPNCHLVLGWSEPPEVRVPVQADRVTYSRIECPVTP
ncbi:MAG: hypothetical protein CMH50_11130 [Myxococcales bacterium]|nr:hypothetical protein [Myxococcales bacterium]